MKKQLLSILTAGCLMAAMVPAAFAADANDLQAQIDELKESAYKTYTGTTLPASSLGSNGDTYVQVLG